MLPSISLLIDVSTGKIGQQDSVGFQLRKSHLVRESPFCLLQTKENGVVFPKRWDSNECHRV